MFFFLSPFSSLWFDLHAYLETEDALVSLISSPFFSFIFFFYFYFLFVWSKFFSSSSILYLFPIYFPN